MDEATLDRARQIAAKQDGLIRWSQLSAVGIDVDGVRRLCRRDIWRRLHREVFLVDAFLYGDGVPARTVIRAAAYAAGPGAVVVASSAAALHGIQGAGIWTGRVELASALST